MTTPHSDFVSFYTTADNTGEFELAYNPKTKEFRETKTFDEPSYGTNVRTCTDYEMSAAEEAAFNERFPDEE